MLKRPKDEPRINWDDQFLLGSDPSPVTLRLMKTPDRDTLSKGEGSKCLTSLFRL
jgi:hypothetical protein